MQKENKLNMDKFNYKNKVLTMAYHKAYIEKGDVGEFSKILEEFNELKDAFNQNDKVLMICELTDLIGAIQLFAEQKFNLSIEDLIKFSDKTIEAFKEGKRK